MTCRIIAHLILSVALLSYATVLPAQVIAQCDAFFIDNNLESPVLRLRGSGGNTNVTSPIAPEQSLDWNIRIEFDLKLANPVQTGGILMYEVPAGDGTVQFSGIATDGSKTFIFDRTRNIEIEGGKGTLRYSISQRKIISANLDIPLPPILPGQPPEISISAIGFSDEDSDPFPNATAQVDFPSPWAFDGRYRVPGSAPGFQYLIWMTGAGGASDQEIENRERSLKNQLELAEVVVFRPTRIIPPIGAFPGLSVGYGSEDINRIVDFIQELQTCGIPGPNLHFLASSAAVDAFENDVYDHLPTEIGAVLLAQPFCPLDIGLCSPRRELPAAVSPRIHGVYDIDMDEPTTEVVAAGPSRFESPIHQELSRYVVLGFEPICGAANSLDVLGRHSRAVGPSEDLATAVLALVTEGEVDGARDLLDLQQALAGGTSIPCEFVTVPDLYGQDQDAARSWLLSQNLDIVSPLASAPSFAPSGTVIDQAPAPGDQVIKGTKVTLWVSSGVTPSFDVDRDGDVDLDDIARARARLRERGSIGFPDINLNGIWDINDLRTLIVNCDLPRCAIP